MNPDQIRGILEKVRPRLVELKSELERKEALLKAGRDVNGDGTFDEKDGAEVKSVRARRDSAQKRIEKLELQLLRMGETDFGGSGGGSSSQSASNGSGGGSSGSERGSQSARSEGSDRRRPTGGGSSSTEASSGRTRSARPRNESPGSAADAGPPEATIQSRLSGSVGKGGRNANDDVKTVQNLLVKAGHKIAVDGLIGPKTIGAITSFQNSNQLEGSGLVNPDDETWTRLKGGGSTAQSADGAEAGSGSGSATGAGTVSEAAAGSGPGSATEAGTGATGGEEAQAEELREQIEENQRFANLSEEELVKTSLIDGDPSELFDEEYMETVAEFDPPYAGNSDLKTLMREIEGGLPSKRIPEVMAELSAVLGPPPSPEELKADYDRFLIVQRQQAANNGGECVEELDDDAHPDFMASRGQLMFGKVLADAFDIHEVFASLLSPTGGLVGPGNSALHLAPDNPVGVHGTLHDAAGYLKANHNEGPGYNYREDPYEELATEAIECLPEALQDWTLPLTGQVSGILYWSSEVGGEYVEARYDEAMEILEDGLEDARDEAAEKINEMLAGLDAAKEQAMGLYEAAEEEVDEQIDSAEEELREMADAAQEQVQEIADAIGDGVEGASEAIDKVAEELANRAGEAEQEMRNFAEAAEEEALGVLDAFSDAVGRVKDSAVEALEDAAEEGESMTDIATERLSALSDFIWG